MLREAMAADAAALAEVHVSSWRAAYRGLIPDAVLDGLSVEKRRERWESNLSLVDTSRSTVVFERGGELIAFATFGVSRDELGSGEVWAIYAAPEAWGTGAGRALLAHGLAYFEEQGFDRVVLWVLEGNARAIRFYEAAGFRFDGGCKDEDGLAHVRMRRDRARITGPGDAPPAAAGPAGSG